MLIRERSAAAGGGTATLPGTRTGRVAPASVGPGYEYGNTRLRAKKAALLTEADLDRLLGRDVDGVLSALDDGPYRQDVLASRPRFAGLTALHHALSANLARTLRAVRGFYAGEAGELVELLLRRFDAPNLVTLLRAQARRLPVDEALELVVPVGTFDPAACREVAVQADLRAAVDLMVAWRLPSHDVALAVSGALAAYERTGDLAGLEDAAVRACASAIDLRLQGIPEDAWPLERVLRTEADRANVLLALRLREARVEGQPPAQDEPFVPGGTVRGPALGEGVAAETREKAVEALAASCLADSWTEALESWAARGDLVAFQRELEAAATLDAIGLFHGGDPLSVAVPVAFVFAKENEVRNLRLVATGASERIPPGLIRREWVMPS